MQIERMKYSRYKAHYADCETVPDSYDKNTRTIEVYIPDGRKKPSGVRGKHFRGYQIGLIDEHGKHGYCTYRAVSSENAMKKHISWCEENGWTPLEVEAVFR